MFSRTQENFAWKKTNLKKKHFNRFGSGSFCVFTTQTQFSAHRLTRTSCVSPMYFCQRHALQYQANPNVQHFFRFVMVFLQKKCLIWSILVISAGFIVCLFFHSWIVCTLSAFRNESSKSSGKTDTFCMISFLPGVN